MVPSAEVIVGLDNPDDAAVYRLTDDLALVLTVDYFTPIVDDPYAFGQIAAANALSDIYAMGGRPVVALNLVGYPVGKLPGEWLADILRGGADKAREAGVIILGGHSVDDAEPKYGMAVVGLIDPTCVCTKGGARPGDKLVLTKPIGTGTVNTAIKRGLAEPAEIAEAIRVMTTLNNLVDTVLAFEVRGMTDVTGFGLLGHASEMARASGVGMRIHAGRVPLLPGAEKYARQDVFPAGSRNNRKWLEDKVIYDDALEEPIRTLLCDAMTSGGLLIPIAPHRAGDLVAALREAGAPAPAIIGECTEEHPGIIQVLP